MAILLPGTVAYFKTASVPDLAQSNRYFHSGAQDTIEEVMGFYVTTSSLARSGKVRNVSPELTDIHKGIGDIASLSAFLHSNEDYR